MRFVILFAIALMLAVGWDSWIDWQNSSYPDSPKRPNIEQVAVLDWATSLPKLSASDRLHVVGDTNRDGMTSAADLEGHQAWSWAKGGLLLANVDDDDQDGRPDWQDQVVNGPQDAEDLARVKIHLPESLRRDGTELYVETEGAAQNFINVFQMLPESEAFVDVTKPAPLELLRGEIELGIEAKHFAHQNWNGIADIRVVVKDATGQAIATDQTRLRVAPWLMLPNSAEATDVYVSAGVYENETMRSQLQQHLQPLGAQLHEYSTDWWEEMWMQDTMEIGYQEIPGHPRMHVVLRANRDADRYPPTLLAPDLGYITVGEPRNLEGVDRLADWFGNLEVSHPVPGFPLGRIYYGRNGDTGIEMQSEIVRFLQMQQVQSPVWVDTSWLAIKHVDEIFNFVPGPNGEAFLIINSPAFGIEQVRSLETLGAGDLLVGYPAITINEALDFVGVNQQLQQQRLDRILEKAKQDFNLPDERIIQLPMLYSDSQEAYGFWSNPVNSIYVNGAVLMGDPLSPEVNGKDYIQHTIQQRLEAVNIPVLFIDDRSYQENKGNVHCATNAKREPVVSDVWQNIPEVLALSPV